MSETNITLPSKPRVVLEEERTGIYEIDGLYPGYGHTLGNSLRRIVLSSLPGAAVVSVKIDGADHEFATVSGVKEDVITILLNLKRVCLKLHGDEPQTITLEQKGVGTITAGSITAPSQVEILNPDQHIAELTDKNATLSIEMVVESGLGYVPREVLRSEKVDIGTIALDANFTPIRRVNYEVENMRVGDRTDFNRLRMHIETDGTIMPRQALEHAIEIMLNQLRAIVGFKEDEELTAAPEAAQPEEAPSQDEEADTDVLKTRIDTLEELSVRTRSALDAAGIRTIGGLVRKRAADVLAVEGIGDKGLQEIEELLTTLGCTLKE